MKKSLDTKGYGVIVVIVLMLAVAIFSVVISEEPTVVDNTTPSPVPTVHLISRATPLPENFVPHAGRWLGKSFAAETANYPPLQLFFDVTVEGTLTGVVSLYPSNPEIPPNAVDLIAKNGCNVEFESFEGFISGQFLSFTEAEVRIEAITCEVKFFGEVTLLEPVRGVFSAAYSESATYALYRGEELTPLEQATGAFLNYCSACHGAYAEGAPGIPTFARPETQAKTDEEILTIINHGVINTVMPAWGNILTDEQKQGMLLLVRDISVLRKAR